MPIQRLGCPKDKSKKEIMVDKNKTPVFGGQSHIIEVRTCSEMDSCEFAEKRRCPHCASYDNGRLTGYHKVESPKQ